MAMDLIEKKDSKKWLLEMTEVHRHGGNAKTKYIIGLAYASGAERIIEEGLQQAVVRLS